MTIVIPTNGQSIISPPGASPTFETVSLTARDGRALNLKHLTPTPKPARGPVLMIVGTGTRANIFNPPTTTTLPQMLHDSGFDVCVLNWRSSIDLPAVEYTLDDAAVLDMPAAVNEVRARTSADAIKAVIHCQGSCAFMMAITAGLLPGVSVVISNSSALHPIMPRIARIKLQIAVGLLAHREPTINPQWGIHAPRPWPKVLNAAIRATHHECHNGAPIPWRWSTLNYGSTAWSAAGRRRQRDARRAVGQLPCGHRHDGRAMRGPH